MGFSPYEKRAQELLRIGKDKTALKFALVWERNEMQNVLIQARLQ